MSGHDDKSVSVTEYHVVFVAIPEVLGPRWEVQWDGGFMGHMTWDKGFAVSIAKAWAKKHRPSKVIVHDRKTGEPQSEISFAADTPRRSKGITRKLD
jgi:hypothetical protein